MTKSSYRFCRKNSIGSFMGWLYLVFCLHKISFATKLVRKGALNKINLDPKLVDEVLMGNVVQAGVGQAPARQANFICWFIR